MREKDGQSARKREVERGGLLFIPTALHNTHERVHARAGVCIVHGNVSRACGKRRQRAANLPGSQPCEYIHRHM